MDNSKGLSGLSSELLAEITHESMTGIIAVSPDSGEIIYINRAGREMLELDSLERTTAIGLFIDPLIPKEVRPGLGRPFDRGLLSAEGAYQNVVLNKFNGHVILVNLGIRTVRRSEQDQIRVLMFEDITFQRRLQREVEVKQDQLHEAFNELLKQNQQLKELDQAKNKFLSLASHELRTPLSAIVATAEVIVEGLTESEEQKDSFIRTIHEQGLMLMELVNDILDFAKIQAGKMDYHIECLDLGSLVKKSIETYQQMAAQSSVSLEFGGSDEDLMGYVDSLRFREIINNIISNAIKYNRTGGKATVAIRNVPDERFIILSVQDQGAGIPESKRSAVFNEFETVGSISKHHKGTGLGMPISKRMAEAMGCELSFESESGVGTTFFLKIPKDKILADSMYSTRPDRDADLISSASDSSAESASEPAA
jgi:signal transduction histidine kinase